MILIPKQLKKKKKTFKREEYGREKESSNLGTPDLKNNNPTDCSSHLLPGRKKNLSETLSEVLTSCRAIPKRVPLHLYIVSEKSGDIAPLIPISVTHNGISQSDLL